MSLPLETGERLGAAAPRGQTHAAGDRHPSFPFDAWYMAAWSSEVADGLFSRRLLGKPVLLYRDEAGSPVALDDFCAHRFAPLSKGKKVAGRVECPYHGLQYDTSGRCVRNPVGKGHIPAGTAIRSYPVVERYRILWIWLGNPELADDSRIPDMSLVPAEGTGHHNIGNYLNVKCNYLLEIDNLMDLSHVNFIHEGSLGNESMKSAEVKVTEEEGKIRADLWMPGTLGGFGEMHGQPCDQWNNMIWMQPSSMLLEFGAVPPGDDPVQNPHNYAFHIITPETENSTHYFYGTSACFDDADAWQAKLIRDAQTQAFLTEDNPMIEAVEDRMGGAEFWSLRPAILPSDAAGVRVRRRLEQMCRAERARATGNHSELAGA